MNKYKVYFFTGLRILVGWHFLYEGIVKLVNPDWTAKMYLMGTRWVFADFFHWMASSEVVMNIVDNLNIWGLILIGLSLFIGLFVRWASVAGALLLLFYFVAYPPIPGYTLGAVNEGSYLLVNKTLIEMVLMIVFSFLPYEYFYGADRWIKRWKEEKARKPVPSVKEEDSSYGRREVLRDLISVPFLGAFAYGLYKKKKWDSYEEKFVTFTNADGKTGATLKSFNFSTMDDLKGKAPMGKIGDVEFSRLIMGGNLIGGWAHSRDLIYVSKLVKAYHTEERVMMTMQLAEECGINAILTNPQLSRIINKYRHETGGKMKFISDCGYGNNFYEGAKVSLESGAHALYCQGEIADRAVLEGRFDDIEKGLELIRSAGRPAGVGAHRIETIKACVEKGIKPDFWVKTLHNHNYWSAHPEAEWHDNMYCFKPEETVSFMETLEEPWIAFKILAAGAIDPKQGFQYAFDNGADFVCVGMYDFQIVEDTNLLLDTLQSVNRKRPWRG